MIPIAMPPTRAPRAPAASLAQSRALRSTAVLVFLWIALALHPATRDTFLTPGNLANITGRVAEIAIIGVGMTFVVLTGGIDLSVGSATAMFGVIAATLSVDYGQPTVVAIAAAVSISVLIGLWHGVLVAIVRIPPFIATLSGFLAYRGLALVLSNSRGMSMHDDLDFLRGRLSSGVSATVCVAGFAIAMAVLIRRHRRRKSYGLPSEGAWMLGGRAAAIAIVSLVALWVYRTSMPVPALIAAIVMALGALILTSTRLGRYAYAIGGNAEAARLSGIPVTRVRILVYVMIAVLTAIAALVDAARTNGVTPGNMGQLRELQVISAVVIGGTSLSGGRATMLGTLLGALIFGTLANGMTLIGIDSNWQQIVTGLIILGASALDSWPTRKDAA